MVILTDDYLLIRLVVWLFNWFVSCLIADLLLVRWEDWLNWLFGYLIGWLLLCWLNTCWILLVRTQLTFSDLRYHVPRITLTNTVTTMLKPKTCGML